jgi:hypothetical protein
LDRDKKWKATSNPKQSKDCSEAIRKYPIALPSPRKNKKIKIKIKKRD